MADPLKKPDDFGYRAGTAARERVGAGLDTHNSLLGRGVATLLGPSVKTAAQVGGFGDGLRGVQPSSAAPPTPAPSAAASPAPRLTAGGAAPLGGMDFSRPAPAATATSASRPAVQRAPAASAATLEPGTLNTFTGPDGVTRRVAPATEQQTAADARRPPVVYSAPSTAAQVQESTGRALDGQRRATLTARADAADVLNPMSAGAEIMRRLENSQGSYFNRGSPSARASQAQAYMGQLAALNAASAAGHGAAYATLQAGAAGEGAANESAAERRQRADEFNVGTQQTMLDRQEAAADRELAARSPARQELIRGADGRVAYIRQDGTAATVRDEEGQPVLTPGPQEDRLSLQNLLESYNDQALAIAENMQIDADQKRQQIDALRSDSLYQPLFSRGSASSGPPPAAVEFLRANPSQAAAFDAKFGAGAAARYLTR